VVTTRPAVSRSGQPDLTPEEQTLYPPAETWVLAAEHPDGFLALTGVRGSSGALVDFTWLYINPAAEALLGRSLAELRGRSLLAELPDFRVPALLERCMRVVETGEPFADEVSFPLTLQGRWFRLVALRRGDGLALWLTDITLRKREEQEARFLAEASHLISASLDVEGALHQLVQRTVPALGDACLLQVVDGRGQPLQLETAASEPTQEALLQEVYRRLLPDMSGRTGGLPCPLESPLLVTGLTPALLESLARDAEHLKLLQALQAHSAMVVPLRARGRTLGVLVLLTLSPERRYGPEELCFAEELADRVALSVDSILLFRESRQAVGQRDEFLSVAAHELRTPTTALKLNAQSLLRGARRGDSGTLPEPLVEKLENINRTASRLSTLVNALLDVSRLDAGRPRLRLEEVDLTTLVRDVAARFERPALQAGSPLLLHATGPAVGTWDRARLEQMVSHLLSNALKYGAGKPVHVQVEASATHVRLCVTDQGIGIAPESLPRLFGRFQRAVSERHYGGLGLGLYFTRQIVESLGGTITVRSAPGAGATFCVDLPLRVRG
jgi:signal transduction histidine kinase